MNGPPDPGRTVGPDADAFLRANTRTFLLVSRGDGSPTAYPMVGLYHDGVLEFSTYRKSAKVTRMLRHPVVGCLVTARDDDPDRRVLLVEGTAEVLPEGADLERGPDARAAAGATPAAMRVPGEIAERSQDRMRSGKRCVVRVTPTRAAFLEASRAAGAGGA